jgi:hypothetical protein
LQKSLTRVRDSRGISNNLLFTSSSTMAMVEVSSPSPTSWSIAVKTVGKGFSPTPDEDDKGGERHFTVLVSPQDSVDVLYDQIEGATGVKACQQRLIYRGRLIGAPGARNNSNSTAAESNTTSSNCTGTPNSTNQTNTNNTREASNNNNTEPKIKDITGLCDGQTIHLVKKRHETPSRGDENNNTNSTTAPSLSNMSEDNNNNNNTSTSNTRQNNNNGGVVVGTGGGGGPQGGSTSLLAALLGLGNLMDDDNNNDNNNTGGTARTTTTQGWGGGGSGGWRSSRLGGAGHRQSSRRPHYRLTLDDLEVPDPGSMESVRQGLLTLHTLVPHAAHDNVNVNENNNNPLAVANHHRHWYRGQWIDCRDTVNQWLEATVVEIMHPQDILAPRRQTYRPFQAEHGIESSLPSSSSRHPNPRRRAAPPFQPSSDPAVSATDMQGRRRLLLEPCDSDSTSENENNDVDDDEDEALSFGGLRPRDTNEGMQLLLIHYNGWPHRWDEWIRSDSERIRPFRTRTRHSTMVR